MSLLNYKRTAPQHITSINELITALSESERSTYNEIVHSINIPISDFSNYCSWSDECYTRNCLIDNEKFELILICWQAGQLTPIHDHGGEECWVKVMDGEFRESLYQMEDEELKLIKSDTSKTNEISYMIDFMGFHSLENVSSTPSMTLHLYAKPIRACNSYDEESGELIHRELTYTTVPESIES